MTAALEGLVKFGLAILKQWHGDGERGDVDGGWIQGMAVRAGVADAVPVHETPCGDVCPCAYWAGEGESVVCYRIRDDVHALMRDPSGLSSLLATPAPGADGVPREVWVTIDNIGLPAEVALYEEDLPARIPFDTKAPYYSAAALAAAKAEGVRSVVKAATARRTGEFAFLCTEDYKLGYRDALGKLLEDVEGFTPTDREATP